jgi:hypothetical protein
MCCVALAPRNCGVQQYASFLGPACALHLTPLSPLVGDQEGGTAYAAGSDGEYNAAMTATEHNAADSHHRKIQAGLECPDARHAKLAEPRRTLVYAAGSDSEYNDADGYSKPAWGYKKAGAF